MRFTNRFLPAAVLSSVCLWMCPNWAAPVGETAQRELSAEELVQEVGTLPIVNIVGFGSKNQIGSIDDMQVAAEKFVAKWNAKFHGRWLLAYGGDSANAEKPDVGFLVKYIRDTYDIRVLAVQSDIVKLKWGGVDKWIDFVHYVPTDTTVNAEGKETVLWGGIKDGHLVGATKMMFNPASPLYRHSSSMGVVGVGIFGGGEIAKAELAQAEKMKLDIDYYPLSAKNPNPGQPFGEIHENALKYDCSKRLKK